MTKYLVLVVLSMFSVSISSDDEGSAVRPLKIEEEPKIDGDLNEPFWRNIEPITDFIQLDPAYGEPATERTEVRICYNSRYLYFGVRCFDSEPEKIIARIYRRDGNLHYDDSVVISIDSLHDQRKAFLFETNPLGAQEDAQIEEGNVYDTSWNAIWFSSGRIDDQGYTLEIAIPFFILRFKPAEEVSMGLMMRRLIRRKYEVAYWPYLKRGYWITSISQFGHLNGLREIERGVNLEIKPYGLAGYSDSSTQKNSTADAGLDVKWGMTSNLTADLTLNTDFAQVESDALQVNLTRFSLYYPEKREFFLESAELFKFGISTDTQLFFSRRIGIRSKEEVPILGGARLYGLVGNTNVGFMSIRTRDVGDVPGELFTVARFKQNVLKRSYVGGIFTSRTGHEPDRDYTYGADFVYRFGSDSRVYGLLSRCNRPGAEGGNWYGMFGTRYSTDLIGGAIVYEDIGIKFDPGVGYVHRRDMRTLFLHGAYKPRPGGIRRLFLNFTRWQTVSHSGVLETSKTSADFEIRCHEGHFFYGGVTSTEDFIRNTYIIASRVSIPPGRYSFFHWWLQARTSDARRLAARGRVDIGTFYGGSKKSFDLLLFIKHIPRFQVNPEVEIEHVNLPDGRFTSTISRLTVAWYLSPNFVSRVVAQYSSLYEELDFNFRVRWIYAPGSEVWVVYDEGRRFGIDGPSLRDRALIAKIVYNFNI